MLHRWILTMCATALASVANHDTHPFRRDGAAASTTFNNNNRLLFDVDGNQIDAYGAKVNHFNGSYYLYGNSFSIEGVAFGIKSYSSPDLENWRYEGFLFDPYSNTPCNGSGGCGRPHIVHDEKTSTYVLWTNAGSNGYRVATSKSPTGQFTFLDSPAAIDSRFNGLQPADFTVEVINGTGYIVFSALNFLDPRAGSIWPPVFQTLYASRLTEDLLNTTQVSYPVRSAAFDLIDQEAESPDIFVQGGRFYISASNTCSYCNGSIALLYHSKSIQGPWERQILECYSCNGQVEGVLQLDDPVTKDVTHVWHSTSVPGGPRTGFGGHIFQPLTFSSNGSAMDLDCSVDAEFPVRFSRGLQSTPSGAATESGEKTPLFAPYGAVCDSDQFDIFQTWKATVNGTLKSVSVNVARSSQTVPLSLTVFKFDSYADLAMPGYRWKELGSASYNASQLTYVFDTALVNITSNVTVLPGDLLGLSVTGSDFAPYCHLEYKTENGSDTRLYQRGVGQNSWRGLQGRTSPVYERLGRAIKFFATYT